MAQLLAFCGIDCGACDAFTATQADDDELREQVAREWSKMTGRQLRPDQINCDGCTVSEGRHAPYLHQCPIRNCASEKGVANCAQCAEYACERLKPVFDNAPEARQALDAIREAD